MASTSHLLLIVWLGAACTLAIFSILYRENAFYRLFEHIFIGLATGQGIYITIVDVLYPLWWKRMINDGHWYWIFALVVGLMFYFVYSRRHAWISRVIFGVFMGFSAGLTFKGFATEYVPQIAASFKPLRGNGLSYWDIANNIVFLVVLLTAMSYFFFSIEHKYKSVRAMSGAGRWLLMFAFGAIFGATVGARMSLLIGRVNFLLSDWLLNSVWPMFHH
jgi:hypothetical protein